MPGTPRPRQIILLVLLGMAPDIDFLLRLLSDTIYLQHHRGITHSLLMLPLWAWLITSVLRRCRRLPGLHPGWIAAALMLHIALDLITSFGTMILAPASDWRATLDLVFIIDPLFTLCLLLPLLAGLLWRRHARLLARTALLLMACYLGMTALLHRQALHIVQHIHPAALETAALPLPFSPFHWQLIARYPNHYQRSSVDLWPGFAGTEPFFSPAWVARYGGNIPAVEQIQWQRLPAMDAIALPAGMPGIEFYRWFARFPVLLARDDMHLEFGDLRFGAGAPGVNAAFRLYLDTTGQPEAWLIWRDAHRSRLR